MKRQSQFIGGEERVLLVPCSRCTRAGIVSSNLEIVGIDDWRCRIEEKSWKEDS